MTSRADPRKNIANALFDFQRKPPSEAARQLLASLGYQGSRTVSVSGVDEFIEMFDPSNELRTRNRALIEEWKSIQILFQLTDDDLTGDNLLFHETKVEQGLMRSYLFFHISLKGETYPRSKLAQITRQINRRFSMPVMVFFTYSSTLSIAVINRRQNKRDENRDVLGKVTLIHGINCHAPHRGHLDILASFSIPELSRTGDVSNFDTLHAALEQVFNIQLLNNIFYKKIQKWFFWAVQVMEFPHGGFDNPDQRNRMAAIRMLTRIIFCWFAREKNLLPEGLFSEKTCRKALNGFDPLSKTDGSYYTAILQNLFFPTLSVPLEQREFRNGRRYNGVNKHYMDHRFFRHEQAFKNPDDIPALFEKIPFLNGGLFTCLDYLEKKGEEVRVDGFSDVASKQPRVPNLLFFGKKVAVDISKATGNPNDTTEEIDGLFTILEAFKFTVTENTPIEEEIALDPELLGRIFENLLAEYNPETCSAAKKQTGAFYTPRPIVDYMVSEALKAHLETVLLKKFPALTAEDVRSRLDILFAYTEATHSFNDKEKLALLDAIYETTILDPACGSGAFPMGMLQKLVYVLDKLDKDHNHWKRRILHDTPSEIKEQTRKWLDSGTADFTWKLGIIQNSIYGVDIQPFAVQIAKLRCFVSLLVDFTVNHKEENSGVPSLPNLDFKFVTANTLIRPPEEARRDDDLLSLEDPFFSEFATLAKEYFFERIPAEKKKLQEQIETLINQQIERHTQQIGDLAVTGTKERARQKEGAESRLKLWVSYRNIFSFRNAHVEFFDPRYFFPTIQGGFDIVIGNPPYVRADEPSDWNQKQRQAILASDQYQTLWEKWDLFVPFIERSYQLLKPDGICALIVSDAFCHSKYAQKAQNWYLQQSRILRLDFCGDIKIFDAAVHNVIPFIQKCDGQDNSPLRRLHIETFGNVRDLPTAPQSELTCRAFFPEDANTPSAVFTCKTLELSELCYISKGMVVHADEKVAQGSFRMEDLVSEYRDKTHIRRFAEGKHLGLWLPETTKWLEWNTNRAPALFSRPTFNELHHAPEKILVQRSPGPDPKCCYDNQQIHFTESSVGFIMWHALSNVCNNSLKKAARYLTERSKTSGADLPQREKLEENSRRFSVKYLLAVMNSSTARDFLRANRRSNIHLYPDDWKKLPIPDITLADQQPLIDLVDSIFTAKTANPAADISKEEAEIDRRVRALYGLTPEEIAIVEGTAK